MEVVSLSLQLVQTSEKIYSFLKDVKNASAELQTISNTLQPLRSVLNDVHNILDRQSSVASTVQGSPRPLPTISESLLRCKEHLQPLESIVDKYRDVWQHDARKRDKVWSSIRVALKKKDIADFQNRIQQEITILNLSLGLESHNYGLHTFSAIMSEIQMLRSTTIQALSVDRLSAPGGISISPSINEHNQAGEIDLRTTDSARLSGIIQRRRDLCLPLFLRHLGFRGLKMSKYLARNEREKSHSSGAKTKLLCEEIVYTWRSTAMSFGLQWSWDAPYGNILPALALYPVVPAELLPSMNREDYNIEHLKADFGTGKLHPFMQSDNGVTLLHVAASMDRLDICHYLIAVGVSSRMGTRSSPGHWAILRGCSIDTARLLLEHGFYSDIPPVIGWGHVAARDAVLGTLGQWLWKQAPLLYDDNGVKQIRVDLLCTIAENMAKKKHPNLAKQLDFPAFDPTALKEALASSHSLGRLFCDPLQRSCDSFETGKNWLRLLSDLGVDVGAYLRAQVTRYTDGSLGTDLILDSGTNYNLPRRLRIDCNKYNEWSLGWEWVFNTLDPGYIVVSEFSAIAADEIDIMNLWPFSDSSGSLWSWEVATEESQRRATRSRRTFDRKLAKKVQKQLRWSRKAIPRSKMPGSWI